jgi:hypothetical protein
VPEYKEHPSLYKTLEVGLQVTHSSRKSAHSETFHPYLAEYTLDMAECEEACLGMSSGSPFLFGDSRGNLFSSDRVPLDQVLSYEAFSHIQPLLARVYFTNPMLNSSYPNEAVKCQSKTLFT